MRKIWSNIQFKEAIKNGFLHNVLSDESIQPSSLDLSIGEYAYRITGKTPELFRLDAVSTIESKIKKVKLKQIDIRGGLLIRAGETYLVPINEYFTLPSEYIIKSSPKSSIGRLFVSLRLMADYSPIYNEAYNTANKEVHFWLLIHPLTFDVIIYPNNTLSQIRISPTGFKQIQGNVLKNLLSKTPILYQRNNKNIPAEQIVSDSLFININLASDDKHTPIAYRTKPSSSAIDLNKRNFYDIKEFFTPIFANADRSLKLERNQYYLIASKELLKIPANLSVELQEHSNVGFEGPFHFAGFIDNGFVGDLVFEIRVDETYPYFTIFDGMMVSKLDIFETEMPDIVYGDNSNNYMLQSGVRVAKYFKTD